MKKIEEEINDDDYPFTEEKNIPIDISLKKVEVVETDIKKLIQNDPTPKGYITADCMGVKNDLHEFEKYMLTLGSPEIVIRNLKDYYKAKTLTKLRGMDEKPSFGKLMIVILFVVILLGILMLFGPKIMQMLSGTGGF